MLQKTNKFDLRYNFIIDQLVIYEKIYASYISTLMIINMSNSLSLIQDDIHDTRLLPPIKYNQESLKNIFKNNMKPILLSATPMKSYNNDIMELINYLKPNTCPLISTDSQKQTFNNNEKSGIININLCEHYIASRYYKKNEQLNI